MIKITGTIKELSEINDFVQFKGIEEDFERCKDLQLTVKLYKGNKPGITDFDKKIEEKVKGKLNYGLYETDYQTPIDIY